MNEIDIARLRLECVCTNVTCLVCEAANEIERLHSLLEQAGIDPVWSDDTGN